MSNRGGLVVRVTTNLRLSVSLTSVEATDQTSAKPKVLWSLFFSQLDTSVSEDSSLAAGLPSNVLVTAGPGTSVGFEHAVA